MDKHMENGREQNALLTGSAQTREESSREQKTGFEMNQNWNRIRTGMLTAIAVMLVMSAAMGSAWAYFTTYTMARGGVVLHMGHEEKVKEDFSGWQKTLNISCMADSRPVYVRARAFCADYDIAYNGQHWTVDGDWAYYIPDSRTLAPGTDLAAAGDELKVAIGVPPGAEGFKDGDTFNVIVVYETTEAQYDQSTGDLLSSTQADWTGKVDTSRKSTTLGGED